MVVELALIDSFGAGRGLDCEFDDLAEASEMLGVAALAVPPEPPLSITDKTNTAVALDNFMGSLLLVERIPYVAGRRHFHMAGT